MTRQSRTLLIIGILAVGGVAALGMIANRYSVLLQRQEPSQLRIGESRAGTPRSADQVAAALRQVDAFIEVRTAVERAMDDGTASAGLLDGVRREALAGARVREADYLQVRDLCREWRRGNATRTPTSFRAAFERRRAEIEALDLE